MHRCMHLRGSRLRLHPCNPVRSNRVFRNALWRDCTQICLCNLHCLCSRMPFYRGHLSRRMHLLHNRRPEHRYIPVRSTTFWCTCFRCIHSPTDNRDPFCSRSNRILPGRCFPYTLFPSSCCMHRGRTLHRNCRTRGHCHHSMRTACRAYRSRNRIQGRQPFSRIFP